MLQTIFQLFKKFFTRDISFSKKRVLGIVLSGGAMKCAYTAGLLSGVEDILKNKKHFIIAASGSAGNATYYASGQLAVGKEIWTEYLSGERLINFSRRKVLDVDYLIDDVFKKKFPLDMNALRRSSIEIIVPAVCYETGAVEYFSSHNLHLDWMEVLRAAKALPVVYGKKVKIGDRHYLDSIASSLWLAHVDEVFRRGATHALFVDLSGEKKISLMSILTGRAFKKFGFKHAVNEFKPHYEDREDLKVNTTEHYYIHPETMIRNLESDKSEILKMWQAGYEKGQSDLALRAFIQSI